MLRPLHAFLIFALHSSAITHQRRNWRWKEKSTLNMSEREVYILYVYCIKLYLPAFLISFSRTFSPWQLKLTFSPLINKEIKNIFYQHVDREMWKVTTTLLLALLTRNEWIYETKECQDLSWNIAMVTMNTHLLKERCHKTYIGNILWSRSFHKFFLFLTYETFKACKTRRIFRT